ncbi:MAG: hypothetical protein GF330_10615 [Candidatus Eisenbacteria bacterium]|nr:hypothetical protein [Candidatus Eisenbacteria bacterium]
MRRAPKMPPGLAVALLATLLLVAGCSKQRVVVSTMVPVIDGALTEAFSSGDVATAREAIPSQILLIRGLCRADSDRVETWTIVTQLYAAFALTFVEIDDPPRAARLYREGMELGLAFLKRIDWFAEAWRRGPDALRAEIAQRHPTDLAPIMMWSAACLGKHVLGNLDRPREMADLPYAHVLADAAIRLDPGYFYGMPHALKGVMHASTPLGLGGDLEAAAEQFALARQYAGEQFIFHDVLFARHYCVTALDEACFVQTLERVLATPPECCRQVRLINLVAQQHAHALLAEREALF